MGAPAGWYEVPNAPGTMRYWDGAAWTADVRPMPPAADARPVSVAIPAPGGQQPQATPLAVAEAISELPGGLGRLAGAFLQQVETAAQQQANGGTASQQPYGIPSAQPYGTPSAQPQGWGPEPTPAPQQGWAPQQASGGSPQQYGAPQPQTWAPQQAPGTAYGSGTGAQQQTWGPQPTVPQPHSPPGGELGDLWAQARQYASSEQGRATGTAIAGGALLADGVVGFGRGRDGIKGALSGMVVGLMFIVLPLFVLKPLIMNDATVHAGEATVQGTVVDQHARIEDKGRMCASEASFVVDGTTYTAASTGSSSSCPSLGSSIKVIYHVADPADARVAPPAWIKAFIWLFPTVGAIAFVTSLWTFVVRAGEISVGGVMLFRGLRARRAAKGL